MGFLFAPVGHAGLLVGRPFGGCGWGRVVIVVPAGSQGLWDPSQIAQVVSGP